GTWGIILALGLGRGQPRARLRRSSVRLRKTGSKVLALPYFIGLGAKSGCRRTAEILRRFHGVFLRFSPCSDVPNRLSHQLILPPVADLKLREQPPVSRSVPWRAKNAG